MNILFLCFFFLCGILGEFLVCFFFKWGKILALFLEGELFFIFFLLDLLYFFFLVICEDFLF